MYIRILRDDKEILFNLNFCWKIEVGYAVPDKESGRAFSTSLKERLTDPNTIRFYKLYFGLETILLRAKIGDPVAAAIEEIYKNAVKAP